MTLCKLRIQHDIDNLAVPLNECKLLILSNYFNSNLCESSALNEHITRLIKKNIINTKTMDNMHIFLFSMNIETPIYNGIYKFILLFPSEYPFKSPKLFCITPVFHPNIDESGNVCLKVLREGWMPGYDINSIVVSISCMFYYLSSEDVLNVKAGELLDNDFEEFKRQVYSVSHRLNI